MEKYYDLIVSLVKSHKKYPGYESILDDIVDDVCSHAKTVIDTVVDEGVIESYLSRIVSTSIVTVPKKLGVSKTRQTVLIIPEEQVLDEQIQELVLESDVSSESDDYNDISNHNSDLVAQDDAYGIVDYENTDTVPEADDELINDVEVNSDNKESEIPVDKSLVDKMINGVSDVAEEHLSDDMDNNSTLEHQEELLSSVDIAVKDDELESEPVNEETSALLDTIYPAENSFGSSGIDELVDNDIETNNLQEESASLELSDNFDSVDTLQISENIEPVISDKDNTFVPPEYKCFAHTRIKEDSSEFDYIVDEIKKLDSKNQGERILEIFSLKYKENKSVDEIAALLNIGDDVVLSVLKEIIYLVKD